LEIEKIIKLKGNSYTKIYEHYESTLDTHGANSKGMDWPISKDLDARFQIMLEVMSSDKSLNLELLDLGCGVGLMIDYLNKVNGFNHLVYKGIDISEKMIVAAKKKHPNYQFASKDIIKDPLQAESFDYIVMNGVITEKLSLSQEEMIDFAEKIISAAFTACRKGIAFNVMSAHVDWKRDDLFHYPLEQLVNFLVKNCSRHIQIRMDYGLYEFTTYVYKQSQTT
jgi:2-polyprenyl-3-methyl-5-hydroxy-6-metoxy-1,4-benzoquinol methylase